MYKEKITIYVCVMRSLATQPLGYRRVTISELGLDDKKKWYSK